MLSKANVLALASGDTWLSKGDNLLLFGPPGSGKSHIAAALGRTLVENGYRVRVEARAAGAALTHVEEDRVRSAADRDVRVGVREHDSRGFAAEFQRYFLQVACGRLHDQLAQPR